MSTQSGDIYCIGVPPGVAHLPLLPQWRCHLATTCEADLPAERPMAVQEQDAHLSPLGFFLMLSQGVFPNDYYLWFAV